MKVLYFAWLREHLDRAEEEIAPPANIATVGELIDWLAARDPLSAAALADRASLRAALDARLVPPETELAGARTLALFPPMTGG